MDFLIIFGVAACILLAVAHPSSDPAVSKIHADARRDPRR